jgi:hypothetical protein
VSIAKSGVIYSRLSLSSLALTASTLDIYKGIDPWITTTISDVLSQEWHMKSKIERLVVMVKSFTLSEMDASVTLLDPSGEMRGTMHRQVLEENNKDKEIRVGTVLALKRVSIFVKFLAPYAPRAK